MLTARLKGRERQKTLGPAKEFCLRGPKLLADGNEVACFSEGLWESGALICTTVPIEVEVKLRFTCDDGRQIDHGPFDSIQLVDGAIRVGPQGDGLLTTLTDTGKWRLGSNGSEWDCVLIRRPHRFDED